jgi:hypothetical protein
MRSADPTDSKGWVAWYAIALFCAPHSGSAAETTLLKGELDRSEGMVVDCRSKERVRVVFPSNVADRFIRMERELNLSEHESVLVEFEVAEIPSASGGPRTVGVMKIVSVRRGRCGDSA